MPMKIMKNDRNWPRVKGPAIGLTIEGSIDYNNNRPHTAHGGISPTEFVQAWLNQQQPQHA